MILDLLAAATIAATPPAGARVIENTPNLYRQPANCAAIVEGELDRQQVALKGRITPSGTLRSGAEYAVERKLEGCAVPTPVGYHPAYIAPGAADAPAKREDGLSNRR